MNPFFFIANNPHYYSGIIAKKEWLMNVSISKTKMAYEQDIEQSIGERFRSSRISCAIPSSFSSAAAELRTLTPDLYNSELCSRLCPGLSSFSKVMLNTSSPSDYVRFPQRTTFKEGWVRLGRDPPMSLQLSPML